MSTNQQLSTLLKGRQVDSVRQRGDELDIDFEDGSTLSIKLSAQTGSVSLSNDSDKVEYKG